MGLPNQLTKYSDHRSNKKENNNKNASNFKDMSSTDPITALSQYHYIKLETFKRNGVGVATPVWFTVDGRKISVITRSQTGKVKRLRNNPNVRIAPCGMRGQLKGQWYDGKAFLANQEELDIGLNLRNKKYGFRARLAGIFSRTKGQLTGINISLD
jgi:PPOX class probable F420-dependent enzyme